METIQPIKDLRGELAAHGVAGVADVLKKSKLFTPAVREANQRAAHQEPEVGQQPETEPETEPEDCPPPDEEAAGWGIPADVLPVPAGGISLTEAARVIFPIMGKARQIFMRGGKLHEIATGENGIDFLDHLSPEAFSNRIEGYGKRVARRETVEEEGGLKRVVWRKCTFPVSTAKTLMASKVALNHLPPIRQLSNCAILTTSGEILARGYHAHAGGTFICRGVKPPEVPLEAAKTALDALLGDFDFPTAADKSRAMASLIAPALKMGGWIVDDFPLDVAEADKSQSGKTYRQKLVCRIYGEVPTSITIAKGGVGSVDEAISTALVRGRPFITLANVRGKIDSTIFEEAIRGAGHLDCRTLRQSTQVDCRPFLWQLSTNGAELTRDLANRSVITRIKKQPAGYRFRSFPEGELEDHIAANQPFYLGAVFSVIREWQRLGCPKTSESRHDFRGWCRALDGIIQHVMGMAPLLDGHKDQQERVGNPNLQWLREILLHARPADHGTEMNVGGLLAIVEDNDIAWPGNPHSKDDPAIRAGRILGKIFKEAEADEITVDGFIFKRTEAPDYSENGKGYVVRKYTFTKQ